MRIHPLGELPDLYASLKHTYAPPQGTHGARGGRSKSVISRYPRGSPLPPRGHKSVPNWPAKCPDFRAFGALAATAHMRITPDLLQRSSKKTLHTFHNQKMVPHFPVSLHIFSKPPICVITRFWTLDVRYDAVGGPYGLYKCSQSFLRQILP